MSSPVSTMGRMRKKGTGSVYRARGRWFWREPQVTVCGVREHGSMHGPYDFRHQAERALEVAMSSSKEQ